MPTLAINKDFLRSYSLVEEYEVGISLFGSEVKSVKNSHVQMKGAYISTRNGELWIRNMHISPYKQGNLKDYNPTRERRLLMHKKEIISISSKVREKGLTLVPLNIYTKRGLIKVAIALARGKNKTDKREEIKRKDINRTLRQALKTRLTRHF